MFCKTDHFSALKMLRILDLADEKAMYCSKLLADMGADVIKIEPPGGLPARNTAPFFKDKPHQERSLYFWHHNTSKRGITLNLESNEGRDIFTRMIGTADIIVESFPPGYMTRLSLDYTRLQEINPRIIVVSISPFGQTGPHKDYKSCNLIASALGGQMYVCGSPDAPPLQPYGEQSYLTACLFGAIGALIAVHHRHFTNEGQHVDISVQESVASVTEHVNIRYLYEKVISKRQGNLHWNKSFRLFPCRDGYILLSLFMHWDTLVEWLDSEGMAADLKEDKWRNPQIRDKEIEHIINVLEKWTRTHAVTELAEQGRLMGFPWASVDSIQRLAANPQLAERDFYTRVSHPELKTDFRYAGAPSKFSISPWKISRRAPLIGEHNQQIFGEELGLSPDEMEALASRGII